MTETCPRCLSRLEFQLQGIFNLPIPEAIPKVIAVSLPGSELLSGSTFGMHGMYQNAPRAAGDGHTVMLMALTCLWLATSNLRLRSSLWRIDYCLLITYYVVINS